MARQEREIRFLSVDDVLAIHDDTLAHEGGGAGVRDPGLLESAVLMARQQFAGQYLHEGLAAMAAAYLFHISGNHPVVDGNKRASTMAALVFLDVNGVRKLPSPGELEQTALAVASGRMGKQELIAWMRERVGEGEAE
jgi:death on curing protein